MYFIFPSIKKKNYYTVHVVCGLTCHTANIIIYGVFMDKFINNTVEFIKCIYYILQKRISNS